MLESRKNREISSELWNDKPVSPEKNAKAQYGARINTHLVSFSTLCSRLTKTANKGIVMPTKYAKVTN